MKSSKYNYFIQYNDNIHLIFNGLSRLFFLVDNKDYQIFVDIINDPAKYENVYSATYKKMSMAGFLVSDEFDELKLIEKKFKREIYKKLYQLIILPTYKCNFSCWYCVQSHSNEFMSQDTADRVKKHIENYIIQNKIKALELSWFGGEPLLYFERIDELASFAKKRCAEHKVVFYNSITTNGYLITENILERMKILGFRSFQITIDGNEEQHNQIRNECNKPSFSIILSNIIRILDALPNVHLTIRFNYTDKNIGSTRIVKDVNKYIPREYRQKIELLFRKVWQIEESDISQDALNELRFLFKKSGYKFADADINNFTSCYAESIHFNTIFHNGAVDKCGNIELEETKGKLNSNGDIDWKSQPIYYANTVFTTPGSCVSCKYLPVCMGPCPIRREKSILMNGCRLKCEIDNPKLFHETSIIEYCENKLTEDGYI